MPIVDFTLEDIKQVVDTAIDARFQIFEKRYEADMTAIQQDFVGVFGRLDTIEGRLDNVEHTIKQNGRLVAQHSQDIMQQRSRQSL